MAGALFGGQTPVCLQCGSKRIRPQTLSDGFFPGGDEVGPWVCDECGYHGTPLYVDSKTFQRPPPPQR